MLIKFLCPAAAAGALMLSSGFAEAVTLFSLDEVAFEAANTITSTEDFEDESFPPGGTQQTLGTVETYGDFTLGVDFGEIVEVGAGLFGLPSAMAGANQFSSSLDVLLPANSTAFGVDLFSLLSASNMAVEVYDIFDNLLASTSIAVGDQSSSGTFLGVTSDEAIGRVNLLSDTDQAEIVDNLRAGTAMTPIPLPASAFLLLTGLLGAGAVTRRKKS
ncbi:MAG: VPLPA-CTERM sorting domain-containing protein [Pseudomonadota bacterium]